MFTLRSLSISSRRLGIGLAVAALAISSVAAPLSASAEENISDGAFEITPMAQKDNGPTTTPPQTNPGPVVTNALKADIQVTAHGKTQVGRVTQYHFKIRNNGPANAPQITGYKEAQTHAIIGDGVSMTDNGYFFFGLNSGQVKDVTVSCNPGAGYVCTKGIALAFMTNMTDPNGSNDIATID